MIFFFLETFFLTLFNKKHTIVISVSHRGYMLTKPFLYFLLNGIFLLLLLKPTIFTSECVLFFVILSFVVITVLQAKACL